MQLARGERTEPNVRATTAELFDGLVASSQNRWPSLAFDVGAINGALSRFLPAGFYYKTFMWPSSPQAWLRYEHVIRAAAGMGRAATGPDPDRYEHQYAHCDVLIVGAGPAGLAAARAAASAGARVIVCDEGSRFGGSLIGDEATIDGDDAMPWIAGTVRELAENPDVTLLARTTAFGWYDDNLLGLRGARHRSSRGAAAARAAAAAVESARKVDRSRVGCARAAGRLCEQRPSGHDARGRRAHLRQALRGAAGIARGDLHDQ